MAHNPSQQQLLPQVMHYANLFNRIVLPDNSILESVYSGDLNNSKIVHHSYHNQHSTLLGRINNSLLSLKQPADNGCFIYFFLTNAFLMCSKILNLSRQNFKIQLLYPIPRNIFE